MVNDTLALSAVQGSTSVGRDDNWYHAMLINTSVENKPSIAEGSQNGCWLWQELGECVDAANIPQYNIRSADDSRHHEGERPVGITDSRLRQYLAGYETAANSTGHVLIVDGMEWPRTARGRALNILRGLRSRATSGSLPRLSMRFWVYYWGQHRF